MLVALLLLTAAGIAWFWLVEDWTLLDAAYMTIITLTTVGYREVHPLSTAGQLFLMVYLVCGLGVFFYAIVGLGELIVRTELKAWFHRREVAGMLKSIKDHYIILGFGRMGQALGEHLEAIGVQFVVVDRDEKAINECTERGWLCIPGDATEDRTLEEAGIDRARGLAVVMDSDADNLFAVLSARLLAPNLQIVARATDQSTAKKMERAGADRVVCLHAAGARSMAQFMINPRVEDFFELATAMGTRMDLTELLVGPDSKYAGKRLRDTDFRQHGIFVVAIQRASGELEIAPGADSFIEVGDRLMAFGSTDSIAAFLNAENAERHQSSSTIPHN